MAKTKLALKVSTALQAFTSALVDLGSAVEALADNPEDARYAGAAQEAYQNTIAMAAGASSAITVLEQHIAGWASESRFKNLFKNKKKLAAARDKVKEYLASSKAVYSDTFKDVQKWKKVLQG